MLSIRPPQVPVLARPLIDAFIEDMRGHCQEFFPGPVATLGGNLDDYVRYGVERAWTRGLDTRRAVAIYVDCMFVLGRDFDRDPLVPWATAVLEDSTIPTGGQRATLLWNEVVRYLDAVTGPEGGAFVRAMVRARALLPAELTGVAEAEFETEARARLRALYPERYDAIEPEHLGPWLALGADKAAAAGLRTAPGCLSVLALMLLLGSHFDHDPQYPWAGRSLEPSEDQEAVRVERLRRAAVAAIDGALATGRGDDGEAS